MAKVLQQQLKQLCTSLQVENIWRQPLRLLSLAKSRHGLTARPRFLRSPVHRTAVLFIRDPLPNEWLSCAGGTVVVPLPTCRVAAELKRSSESVQKVQKPQPRGRVWLLVQRSLRNTHKSTHFLPQSGATWLSATQRQRAEERCLGVAGRLTQPHAETQQQTKQSSSPGTPGRSGFLTETQ